MPRRALLPLLASLALVLAACGDNEDTVADRDSGASTAETQTQPTEPASGCRRVEEPEPKETELDKPSERLDPKETWIVSMKTSCGSIEIELDVEDNPKTAASFAHLVREGFYDGLAFHRVVPGFVVQGGDPENSGQGGPGYSVTEAPPRNTKYTKGLIAMAKTELEDPGTSGSQFFIVTAPDAGLPPDYAVAGKVVDGEDVVDLLAALPNDPSDNRPTEPAIIEAATLSSR